LLKLALPAALCTLVLCTACSSSNNNKNRPAQLTTIAGTPAASVRTPGAPGGASPAAATSNSTPFPSVAAGTAAAATPAAAEASATQTPSPAAAAASATTAAQAPTPTQAATAAPATAAATAPPAATATSAPAASAASGARSAASAGDLIDQIKLTAADLPSGFNVGGLAGHQPNQQAITGYADPQAVLKLFNDTGRQDGYIQQISSPDTGSGIGVSIEVWGDEAGAKAFFDQYPSPPADVKPQPFTLPQPLGDQSYAYQYALGAGSGTSIAWRRGRVVLGVGEAASGQTVLDHLLQIAAILDAKAQAAQQ